MSLDADARELLLYMENDEGVYRAYYVPAYEHINRKLDRGTFRLQEAINDVLRAVNSAAKQYRLEHGSMNEAWYRMFPSAVREQVATQIVEEIRDEWRQHNP